MELEIKRPGVVLPRRVGTPDGPTESQARRGPWRRTSPGLYVPVDVPRTTHQRIVEAVAGAPPGSALTGWAALHWSGAPWFEGRMTDRSEIPVQIAIGDTATPRSRPGVTFCRDWLFPDDIGDFDGLPLTRPERSATVAALRAISFEATVQTIDMALHAGAFDLPRFIAYVERLRGRPGTRRLNSALLHAREGVWSPMETTMRLEWWVARPTAPLLCNQPLRDTAGGHLLTPDLFDPEFGVAGEYDGVIHDELHVRRRDLDREERARDAGIEVVSMNSADLRDRSSFIRRLHAAYARSGDRTPRWSLTHQSKAS